MRRVRLEVYVSVEDTVTNVEVVDYVKTAVNRYADHVGLRDHLTETDVAKDAYVQFIYRT